jgi:aldose 1-epimerase
MIWPLECCFLIYSGLILVKFEVIQEGMDIKQEPFGHTPDGTPVDIYSLGNDNGLKVRITNYGGTIVSLIAPDRTGRPGDVALGFNTLQEYVEKSPYFGCIIGRFANRIARGRFMLDGVTHSLAQNDGHNSLHGGWKGFDKVVWAATEFESDGSVGLTLNYLSPDGEEGYPGNLAVRVAYTLTNANEVKINYSATTDRPTVINLTNHTYFNLSGTGDILGHELMLAAERFTPIDETLIPTGELRSVSGTPFDFWRSTPVGERIDEDEEQLPFGGGYDHNFVLDNPSGKLVLAARVEEPTTGRTLELYTTEPGIQFYSGNFLDRTLIGKYGAVYRRRTGFCLEAQHYPDSPNQSAFPSSMLEPGDEYGQTTIFRFSTKRSTS